MSSPAERVAQGVALIVTGIVWRLIVDYQIRNWAYLPKHWPFLPESRKWMLYLFRNVLSPAAFTIGCLVLGATATRWIIANFP